MRDSAIREIAAHAKAREQKRREADLVKRVAAYLEGTEAVRNCVAKEIIAIVQEETD